MKYIIKALSITIFSAGLMHFGAAQASSDWNTAATNAMGIIGSSSSSYHTMLWDLSMMGNYIHAQMGTDENFRGMVLALRAIRLAIAAGYDANTTAIDLGNSLSDLDWFTGFAIKEGSGVQSSTWTDWNNNRANLRAALKSFTAS